MSVDPSTLDPSVFDPTAPNAFTVLRLHGIGVVPYSARGLKQTLAPIDQSSQLKRDVNGGLQDISFVGFRKYKSTITGDDMEPPNFDGVFPGQQVEVECVSRLAYAPSQQARQRPAVEGSEVDEGAHTYYRPILTMRVMNWNVDEDEYGRAVSWSMDLEEV